MLPASGKFVVARLGGTRTTDANQVFYDFSDSFFFPSYFGWNWDALSDCLRDLHWLPADGYLVIVDNAPQLLPDSAPDQRTLFRVLAHAVRHWSGAGGRPEGRSVPFTVLLLCDHEEEAVHLRQAVYQALHETR
ncbi:barstar family protein [Micromonospora sp. LOL_023]|uniref:barstar family protein n=1 Tax=Micromonospora sp. LOL_023 TaxID=3345418 RepID=UPI003A8C31AE